MNKLFLGYPPERIRTEIEKRFNPSTIDFNSKWIGHVKITNQTQQEVFVDEDIILYNWYEGTSETVLVYDSTGTKWLTYSIGGKSLIFSYKNYGSSQNDQWSLMSNKSYFDTIKTIDIENIKSLWHSHKHLLTIHLEWSKK